MWDPGGVWFWPLRSLLFHFWTTAVYSTSIKTIYFHVVKMVWSGLIGSAHYTGIHNSGVEPWEILSIYLKILLLRVYPLLKTLLSCMNGRHQYEHKNQGRVVKLQTTYSPCSYGSAWFWHWNQVLLKNASCHPLLSMGRERVRGRELYNQTQVKKNRQSISSSCLLSVWRQSIHYFTPHHIWNTFPLKGQ